MAAVVAIDAGTTGVRAVAFDTYDSHELAGSYRELTQHYPRPGWVEHDPAEIWDLVRATLTEVAGQLAEERHAIACIGITNQRETVVAWDRSTGKVLAPAIVWQDRRTAVLCDALAEDGHLDQVQRTTGLVLDPYFSASKMSWLLHEGAVRSQRLALGTVDSWVCWNLTGGTEGGVFATDPSNASRTSLYDITARHWSEPMCELFGVPRSHLAEVLPSSGRFGVTAAGIAGDLPSGIPVSGVAGDQAAALFGQACFEVGSAKATYGTGSFVLMNAGESCPEPVDGVLTSVAWELAGVAATGPVPALGTTHAPSGSSVVEVPPEALSGAPAGPPGRGTQLRPPSIAYALEGAVFVTGAAIQWLRDGLGIVDEVSEVGPLAASVDSTEGVTLVPAFTGLGCPWWDPYARGTIVGITRGTNRAHLARAVLESIAFSLRDALEPMYAASGGASGTLRVDGGASVVDLLLQMQADQLKSGVRRSLAREVTCQGAAWLAGLAEGVWGSLDDLSSMWRGGEEILPSLSASAADDAHRRWLAAVERSRAWASS